MNNPFFWLGISILLVAISLLALLTVAILVLQELARAARSAEKLLDTLNRELPPTLNDLRLTGRELSDLSDEVSGGVQSARSVVQQVDQGLTEAKIQAKRAQITGRSLVAGATAALRVLTGTPRRRRRRPPTRRPPVAPIYKPDPAPGKTPASQSMPAPAASASPPPNPGAAPSPTSEQSVIQTASEANSPVERPQAPASKSAQPNAQR